MRMMKRDLALLALVVLALACPPCVLYVAKLVHTLGEGGSVADYDQLARIPVLEEWCDRIPRAATEIRYYVRPHGLMFVADFALNETQFMEWARDQRWTVESVRDPPGHLFSSTGPDGSTHLITVRDGYYVHKGGVTSTSFANVKPNIEVAFDRRANRAYYRELWPD